MHITREWLLANGIASETLDRALGHAQAVQVIPLTPGVEFIKSPRPGEPTWELTISNWRPASLNELFRSVKTRSRLKKRDRRVLIDSFFGTPVPPATGKRRVGLRLVYVKGERRHDPDAFWKSLLDGLKHAKMLVNDSADWCEHGRVNYARGIRIETTVILEDIA